MFFSNSGKQKKAVMGVETLIIFIAMILVAAVAAAVIIRTSGVLQERAFAVGGQTRKRLVTGLEVIEMLGEANTTAKNIQNMEFSIRLRTGSTPIQLRSTQITFNTQNSALTASLQHSLNDENVDNFTTVTNTTWTQLSADLDEDGLFDYVRVGINGIANNETLEFNLSSTGIIHVSLGEDLQSAASTEVENITLDEEPIMLSENIYGYATINHANVSYSNSLTNTSVVVRRFRVDNICNYDTVIPERFYCIVPRLGNRDTVLEYGEVYLIKYRLRTVNAMDEEETFQINIIPKEGSITYIAGSVPDVLNDRKLILWPN